MARDVQIGNLCHTNKAFTLLELLASVLVLALILGICARVLGQTGETWARAKSRVEQFRDARLSFELITRNLNQATLNTYWDYDDPLNPTDYQRQSELQFLTDWGSEVFTSALPTFHPGHAIFFQAPLGYTHQNNLRGLNSLLNGRGYFIEFGNDAAERPAFIAATGTGATIRNRYRLLEFSPPTEENSIYNYTRSDPSTPSVQPTEAPSSNWINETMLAKHSRPVADNIIALIISPRTPASNTGAQTWDIAPDYSYDSNDPSNPQTLNTLPPLIQVTLIAISEESASLLALQHGSSPPPIFPTAPGFDHFRDPAKYNDDLAALEAELLAQRIDFRVFTSTIALRAAKWSAN